MTTYEFYRLNVGEQVDTASKSVLNYIDSEMEGCFTPKNVLAALLAFSDEIAIVSQVTEDSVVNNFGF